MTEPTAEAAVVDPIAVIAGATLPTRMIPVCFATHLTTRFEQLRQELVDLASKPDSGGSLAGAVPAAIRAELADLEQQMRANTVEITLRAMPRKAFRTLKRDHPPRKEDDGTVNRRDMMLGVNEDTFFEPLLRACLAAPVLDEDTFRTLVDERLIDAQYELLTTAAWRLNVNVVDLPFSYGGSPTTPPSENG